MVRKTSKSTLVLAVLTSICIFALSVSTVADVDEYSSTASLFKIGTGARPLGMGNAFVGLADGSGSLFYNPAGLAFRKKASLTSFYTEQYGSLSYGSVQFSRQNMGLSYLQLSSGTLEERDLYGNTTGEFGFTSRGVIGAYARKFHSAGLALQGKVYNTANRDSAIGYSLSPSVLYRVEPFQIGAIFKNLVSTDIFYDKDYTEPWQKELTIGIAYLKDNLKVGLDFDALLDKRGIEPGVVRLGAEGVVFSHVSLRAGVTSKLQNSIGLSVNLKDWRFDYSFRFHRELNNIHRLSFTFQGIELEPLINKLSESIPYFEKLKNCDFKCF